MRLWSLHPKHLDTKALVASWREGLLAYHVLQGKTTGYKNHPQLIRFRECPNPIFSLEAYLHSICDEADIRGYHFDRSKLSPKQSPPQVPLTRGQLQHELEHLRKKIAGRAPAELFRIEGQIVPHPLFILTDGEVEDWERL